MRARGDGPIGATGRRCGGLVGGSGQGLKHLVEDLGEIDAREISTIEIGEGIVVRVGRYGPYVEETVPRGVDLSTGEMTDDAAVTPRRATINDDIAPDEMTPAKARELLDAVGRRRQGARPGPRQPAATSSPRPVATAPTSPRCSTRRPAALKGKAKVKPRTASLFKDMDLATLDLDTALKLLSLPRVVGVSTEEDGTEVEITAQNGRYGPYLKKDTDSRSLTTEQQLFDITLEEALAIYAQPKQRGRAASAPLKELGNDPVSGKPMVVKDGRFGPYVTDGETNSTLRKGDEPESITPERGCRAARREAGQGPHHPQAGCQEDAPRRPPRRRRRPRRPLPRSQRPRRRRDRMPIEPTTARQLDHRLATRAVRPSAAVRGGRAGPRRRARVVRRGRHAVGSLRR